VEGLSLPDLAATLQKCRLFVSNDSGAAHFAAACGVKVRMIHGSTAPEWTGVGMPVEAPRRWCQPCYRKSCPFDLQCLKSVSVEQVMEGL
jgi:heptosyltransferase-2